MRLSHKFSIYVPSTVDVNTKTDSAEHVRKTLEFLSGLFGGATATKSSGAWVSESAGLVVEDVTICYAYCNMLQRIKHASTVKAFAKMLRDEMRQEAVSVEIDNGLLFV